MVHIAYVVLVEHIYNLLGLVAYLGDSFYHITIFIFK